MTRPDTPAQEHADVVRRSLYDDVGRASREALSALDALLTTVERLTAERDEAVMKKARMDNWGYSDRGLQARAEAAERERDEARAEIIAATTWYADNFGGGEDDPDPADMTLGQMLLAIYDWGNARAALSEEEQGEQA